MFSRQPKCNPNITIDPPECLSKISFTTPKSCHTEAFAEDIAVVRSKFQVPIHLAKKIFLNYTSTPERYKPPQSRYKEEECETLSTKISPCVVGTPDQPVYCSVRP